MGVRYPLYAHVHHGYGLNDAFDRSVTLLLEPQPATLQQPAPIQARLLSLAHASFCHLK